MARVAAVFPFLAVAGLAASPYAQDGAPVGAEAAAGAPAEAVPAEAVPAEAVPAEAAPADVPAGQNTVLYPEATRSDFMLNCMESGAPEPVCTCVLTRMEAVWTVEQLNRDEVDADWIIAETEVCLAPYLR